MKRREKRKARGTGTNIGLEVLDFAVDSMELIWLILSFPIRILFRGLAAVLTD